MPAARNHGLQEHDFVAIDNYLKRNAVACCGGTTARQCLVITELGRSGSMTLVELGRRLGLDKGWLSRVIDALRTEGIVVKKAGTGDRRTVEISLSADGEERSHALNQTLNDHSDRILARIPAEERPGVLRALGLLEAALRAEVSAGSVDSKKEGKVGNACSCHR